MVTAVGSRVDESVTLVGAIEKFSIVATTVSSPSTTASSKTFTVVVWEVLPGTNVTAANEVAFS